jgi:hypothetical protein
MWLYDDFDNTTGTEAYAAAINNVFNGGGGSTSVATFYKDCNYGGAAVGLAAGSYTLSGLQSFGIVNDDISSLQIQSGYRVTLYWDDNYAGTTLVKTASDACLVDDGWNDKVSSLVISATAAARTSITTPEKNTISNLPGQQELKLFNSPDLAGIPVRIYDIMGRQVMQVRPTANRINITSLSPGVYVLVYMVKGKQVSLRFVK